MGQAKKTCKPGGGTSDLGCATELWERVSSRATQRLFVETKSRTAKKVARVLNLAIRGGPAIITDTQAVLKLAENYGFSSVRINVDHLAQLLSVYIASQELTK